jgi:hypothetical protein
MYLLTLVAGVVLGIYIDTLRKNHRADYYLQQLKKLAAHTDAMRDSLELMTNKVERLQRGKHTAVDEKIDAGMADGIKFVLTEKLRRAEY